MEKSTQFTRCPTCKTAFKVSEQLLTKAAGKVRCGACLEIFQATDFLLKPSTSNQTQTNSTTMVRDMVEQSLSSGNTADTNSDSVVDASPVDQSKPERKPTIEFDASIRNNPFERLIPSEADLADDKLDLESSDSERQHRDDVDFDDWVDEEFEQSSKTAKQDSEISEELLDLDKTSQQDESLRVLSQEVDELLDFDESPSSEKPEKEKPATTETVNQNPKNAKSNAQKSSDYIENDVYEHDIFEDDIFEAPLNSDDEPELGQTQSIFFDESMLDNLSNEEEVEKNKVKPSEVVEQQAKENDDDDDHDEIISIEEYEQEMGIKYNIGSQLEDASYEPDPLDEFDSVVDDYPSELRSKMIMAASALLVIILLSQIWSNRQAIAWNDTWGGAMKGVCVLLPCDLKAQRDISKIKLLQRQVSPDEELEETLDIKVMFVNQATFAQPYPNIKIIFSDSNNNPVSTKVFTPADYLKGSQQGELMPINTEVHIEFKTDLEYPDALGFEFIFE
ncbi:MAG: DUF3426 domain-containing protein [Enterobacterales bacterium]|nr:DUF3426 domain-containing protein [Enterobacterales bacterium]